MQVGDTIMHKPFVLRYCKDSSEAVCKEVPCRVVWIHPGGSVRRGGAADGDICVPRVCAVRDNERKRGAKT